ncbi:putative metalloprotease CJM1_0395 family protein [Oceanimonas baumannii]|uniref:putative metalloprotease CJM1_0395 family protein n=1 Tax=Oceanimonas baumannii TaxID=129578 RepID=UPI003A9266CB
MNIDNRLNHDPIFTSASLAASQPRQTNEQRERVPPTEQADSFAGRDERREQGNNELALYDARGQETGHAARAGDLPADSKDSTEDEQQTARSTAHPAKPSGEPMTEAEMLELNDLKLRDQEVRTHEQQHAAMGGQHTGAPNYEFETGPDGKQYAVEGHVQVDMSPVPDDPEATIEKMQQVKAAALAPAEPSQADRSAAAQADQLITEARAELREQQGETSQADKPGSHATGDASPDKETASAESAHLPSHMQHRHDVIAGMYGRTAEHQSRALIGLA